MELSQYLKIVKNDLRFFIAVIGVITVGTLAYFYFQPDAYRTSLTLNITRAGSQNTDDYRYDGFYRLQADERFAETVVEWLSSPRIAADITVPGEDGRPQAKNLSAERRSSQVVAVQYQTRTLREAENISLRIAETLSRTADKLNESQKEENWFKIVAEKPLSVRYQPDYLKIILASFLGGLFASFWLVMIRHYLKP